MDSCIENMNEDCKKIFDEENFSSEGSIYERFNDPIENPPFPYTFTENGALALSTSGDKCLDFFTRIVRNAPLNDYLSAFTEAYNESPEMALQMLLNLRDIRDGKGEKLISQILMIYLKFAKPSVYRYLLPKFISYGYWKDILVICDITQRYFLKIEPSADKLNIINLIDYEMTLMAIEIKKDLAILSETSSAKKAISLAGKWAPSEGCHYDKQVKVPLSKRLRNLLSMSAKDYRIAISKLRAHLNILEMLMATGRFSNIDFSHIPSVAHNKMRAAFKREKNSAGKETEERKELKMRYEEYLKALSKGDPSVKINTKGIQPHELIVKYLEKDSYLDETTEAQWRSLVDEIRKIGTFNNTMAIVDVSASMLGVPMQVSIALGILIATLTCAPYNGQMITFHEKPSWFSIDINESLLENVKKTKNMSWGGNTNILSVFQLILKKAVDNHLTQEQMIKQLFIFTDMQFDKASSFQSGWKTTYKTITKMYSDAGYITPKIIFWNLRTSITKTLSVDKGEEGVAMLSGFSAELLKSILNAEIITPLSLLLKVLEPYKIDLTGCDTSPLVQSDINQEMLSKVIKEAAIKKSHKNKNCRKEEILMLSKVIKEAAINK